MIGIVKKNLFWILIVGVTLFTFWDLPKTFYQQDEWQSLGHNLVQGIAPFFRANPLLLAFSELRPLSTVLYVVLLGFFKFTVVPSAIFAVTIHIANAFLTFYVVRQITKKDLIALLAALFIATNSVTHQAITWVSAVATLPAMTFILVSILTYLKFIEDDNKKYLLISVFSLIISLYFKGVGLFLFILLPAAYFIYKPLPFNKENILKVLKFNLPLVLVGFIMVGTRLGHFFLRSTDVVGYVSTGNSNIFQTIMLRTITYPLTSLFQIFIPPMDFYPQMSQITINQYKFLIGSPVKDLVAQSVASDMVSILGAFAISVIVWIVIAKSKEKITQKNIIFALLFFFLSFTTYVFLDRDSSYLSSRYFYVGAFAAGIIFGYIAYFLANLNKYSKWIIFSIVFLFLFHHANVVRENIDQQVKLGNERKAVLNGIKALKPSLDDQTIFYVTSDKEYYGPITNPFQNGLGYVLEVWYYDGNNIPKEFLTGNFLWDLGSEGYKNSGGIGFGYFQDIDKVSDSVKKGKFKTENVYGFFINSKEQKVIDITKETRERISTISAITQND